MSSSNTSSVFSSSAFGELCSSFDAFISNSSYFEYINDDGTIFIDDYDFIHKPLHYPIAKIIRKVVGVDIRFNDEDIITIDQHLTQIENKACLYCGRDETELKNEGEENAVLGCPCHHKNLICLNCCLGYAKSCGGSSVKCAFREHMINFNKTIISEDILRPININDGDYVRYLKEKKFDEGFRYNFNFWNENIKNKTYIYDDYTEIYKFLCENLITAINERLGINFNINDPLFYKSFYFYEEDDDNIIKWDMGGYDFKDPNFMWDGFIIKALVRVGNSYDKISINLEELDSIVSRIEDTFKDGIIEGFDRESIFNMLYPKFKNIFGDHTNITFTNLFNVERDEETAYALLVGMCDDEMIRDEIKNIIDNGDYDGSELGYYYSDVEFRSENLICWFDFEESVFY